MPLKSIEVRARRDGNPGAAVSSSPKRDVVTGDYRRGGESAVAGVRAVPCEGHERAAAQGASQLAAREHPGRHRPPQADPRNRADALADDLRAGDRKPDRRRVRRHGLVRRPAHGDHRRPLRVRPGRTRRLGQEDHGGPGPNVDKKPFKTASSSSFSCTDRWQEAQDADFDYGVIHLPAISARRSGASRSACCRTRR